MSEKPETTVIGSLPRSRPARRSDKRAAKPTPTAKPEPTGTTRTTARATPRPPVEPPATAAATPPQREAAAAARPEGTELIGTVVKAAAELAEIGLAVGARALRTAVSRLPRP